PPPPPRFFKRILGIRIFFRFFVGLVFFYILKLIVLCQFPGCFIFAKIVGLVVFFRHWGKGVIINVAVLRAASGGG
ncbi:hypothetical protein ACVGWQ_15965, partial [Enterobacter hormaechei]